MDYFRMERIHEASFQQWERRVWDVWYSLLWFKINQLLGQFVNIAYLQGICDSWIKSSPNGAKWPENSTKTFGISDKVKRSKAKAWPDCSGGQRSPRRPGFISCPGDCNQPSGTDFHQEKRAAFCTVFIQSAVTAGWHTAPDRQRKWRY